MGRKRKDVEVVQVVDEVDAETAVDPILEAMIQKAMEQSISHASCSNCQCYIGGLCHLNPPSAQLVSRWPAVNEDDWCGHWRS